MFRALTAIVRKRYEQRGSFGSQITQKYRRDIMNKDSCVPWCLGGFRCRRGEKPHPVGLRGFGDGWMGVYGVRPSRRRLRPPADPPARPIRLFRLARGGKLMTDAGGAVLFKSAVEERSGRRPPSLPTVLPNDRRRSCRHDRNILA